MSFADWDDFNAKTRPPKQDPPPTAQQLWDIAYESGREDRDVQGESPDMVARTRQDTAERRAEFDALLQRLVGIRKP